MNYLKRFNEITKKEIRLQFTNYESRTGGDAST